MPRVGNKHFPYTAKGRAAAASFRKMMSEDSGKSEKPPIGSPATKEPKVPKGPKRGASAPAPRTTPGTRDAAQAAEARRERLMEARNRATLEADYKAKGVKPPARTSSRGRRRK